MALRWMAIEIAGNDPGDRNGEQCRDNSNNSYSNNSNRKTSKRLPEKPSSSALRSLSKTSTKSTTLISNFSLTNNEDDLAVQQEQRRDSKTIPSSLSASSSSSSSSSQRKKQQQSSQRRLADGQPPPFTGETWMKIKGTMSISLPERAKLQLVDDWDAITRQERLVALPRQPNVRDILVSYCDAFSERQKMTRDLQGINVMTLNELLSGLVSYMEKVIGMVLLYRFERQQYLSICRQQAAGKLPGSIVDIYGAEHLLRLLVKISSLAANARLNERETSIMGKVLSDLAHFMAERASEVFMREYENAPNEYISLNKVV